MVTVLFNYRKLGLFCGYKYEQMQPQSLWQRSSQLGPAFVPHVLHVG